MRYSRGYHQLIEHQPKPNRLNDVCGVMTGLIVGLLMAAMVLGWIA